MKLTQLELTLFQLKQSLDALQTVLIQFSLHISHMQLFSKFHKHMLPHGTIATLPNDKWHPGKGRFIWLFASSLDVNVEPLDI